MAELAALVDDVILVDDHSRDGTAGLACDLGLTVIEPGQPASN